MKMNNYVNDCLERRANNLKSRYEQPKIGPDFSDSVDFSPIPTPEEQTALLDKMNQEIVEPTPPVIPPPSTKLTMEEYEVWRATGYKNGVIWGNPGISKDAVYKNNLVLAIQAHKKLQMNPRAALEYCEKNGISGEELEYVKRASPELVEQKD